MHVIMAICSEQPVRASTLVIRDEAEQSSLDRIKSIALAISRLYENVLGRESTANEVQEWLSLLANGLEFHQLVLLLLARPVHSPQASREHPSILPDLSNGQFLQRVYKFTNGKVCSSAEVENLTSCLEAKILTREYVLAQVFTDAIQEDQDNCTLNSKQSSCRIMGTLKHLTEVEWRTRCLTTSAESFETPLSPYLHKFNITKEGRPLVSAIASIYRGGAFIEQFMENMTNQTIFQDCCELIIVNANSPDNEYKIIERYISRGHNIKYIAINHRINIYESWNIAIRSAGGEYITNTNVDDLRRQDSLERQAGALDNLDFADVIYQDFYYTLDAFLSFEEIELLGFKSNLPIITPHNLMQFNSPHNAPMWRKKLHDELGYFDTKFFSAGDYDFWLRCLSAGKIFFKLNDPHIAYYHNPFGLSTRADTAGVSETRVIKKNHLHLVAPESMTMPIRDFCNLLPYKDPQSCVNDPYNRYQHCQHALRELAAKAKIAAKGPAEC